MAHAEIVELPELAATLSMGGRFGAIIIRLSIRSRFAAIKKLWWLVLQLSKSKPCTISLELDSS
jgi:hypothetical protein